jgi:hypothetical protein
MTDLWGLKLLAGEWTRSVPRDNQLVLHVTQATLGGALAQRGMRKQDAPTVFQSRLADHLKQITYTQNSMEG